jgi:hypothetical protein
VFLLSISFTSYVKRERTVEAIYNPHTFNQFGKRALAVGGANTVPE